MPRPRKPTRLLAISGALKRDKKRHRARQNEPVDSHPIGKCPPGLTAAERRAYREIVRRAVPGVLTYADGVAVEAAAKLLAKMRSNADAADISRRELARQVAAADFSDPEALRATFKDFAETIFRVRPYSAADQANLRALLGQFGMMPIDRQRIDVDKPETTTNPFADI